MRIELEDRSRQAAPPTRPSGCATAPAAPCARSKARCGSPRRTSRATSCWSPGSCYRLRTRGLAIVNALGGGAAVSFA